MLTTIAGGRMDWKHVQRYGDAMADAHYGTPPSGWCVWPCVVLCGLVARLNQAWRDWRGKKYFWTIILCFTSKKTCRSFFYYWQEILKRNQVAMCLPCASAGFLEVLLTSESLINRVILRLNLLELVRIFTLVSWRRAVLKGVVSTIWLLFDLVRHLTREAYTQWQI